MELISLGIQQNQRNMLENTQRSSDGLRTNMMRERKEKAGVRKNHSIDTAELSSDLGDMGDDLLGGMDMDDLLGGGGGGGAAMFRKMWEEDVEEEDNKAQMMSAETLFDDGQNMNMLSDKLGDQKDDPALWANAPTYAEQEKATATEPEETVEEKSVIDTPDKVGAEVPPEVPPLEEKEEESEVSTSGTQSASPEKEINIPEKAEKVEITADSKATNSKREEVVKISVPAFETEEEQEPVNEDELKASVAVSLAPISLLDNSEGFIFHEATIESTSSTHKNRSHNEAEKLKVPKELTKTLDTLIVNTGCTQRAIEELRLILSRFGKGILDICVASGVKVQVCNKQSFTTKLVQACPSLQGKDLGYGAFLPKEKICLVCEEILDYDSEKYATCRGFHPALYCFAMAWDFAMGEDNFASLTSPVIKSYADACNTNLEGHKAPDKMSVTSPVHYFAQSVSSYLEANDCADPLWTKDDLYDFDRFMYDYVEYLYNKNNR